MWSPGIESLRKVSRLSSCSEQSAIFYFEVYTDKKVRDFNRMVLPPVVMWKKKVPETRNSAVALLFLFSVVVRRVDIISVGGRRYSALRNLNFKFFRYFLFFLAALSDLYVASPTKLQAKHKESQTRVHICVTSYVR
jgi:hypothetical protein